jgi:tetratricopeptide (TPR) repeat protein
VFISSTFKDMQAERAYLVRQTFPALRRRFRAEGVETLDVDLRWGITRGEALRGKTLARCFEEIDRCRPFFIGIIGERYGWVPDARALGVSAMKPYRVASYAGLSATEMEICYGVLDGGPSPHALFFFRTSSRRPVSASPDEDEERKRAQALKDRIAASGARVISFESAEELGSCVEAGLAEVFEQAGLFSPPLESTRDRDRAFHRAYAGSRIGIHLGAGSALASLDKMVASGGTPIRVSGESGSGKGALLANWCARRRADNPDDIVFEHYLAASATSTNPLTIVRRLWIALDEGTDDHVPLPEGEMMFAELPARLARAEAIAAASGRQIVVALGGLDRLVSGTGLAWLPLHCGLRVHFILSCGEGISGAELARRGCRDVRVGPLPARARASMARLVLDRVGKHLDGDQLGSIASDPKCGSPLFLRRLLEELRVDAIFETLDDKLARCLACADATELFELVLERVEADCGAAFPADALPLMLFSRAGLEEAELRTLANGTPLQLASLHHALGESLMEIDGRLALGLAPLQAAVLRRYAAYEASEQATRRRIAEHFARSEDEIRRADEVPFQLQALEDWDGLADFLLNLENIPALRAWGDHDLLGYWLALMEADAPRPSDLIDAVRNQLGHAFEWDEDRAGLARHALAFVRFAGAVGPAIVGLASDIVSACERLRGSTDPASFGCRAELALAHARNGDFLGAAEIERSLLAAEAAHYGPDHEEVLITRNNLAETLRELGDFEAAITVNEEILAIRLGTLGPHHASTLLTKANLALSLASLGKLAEARRLEEEVLEGRSRLLGARHPDTLTILNNLAVTIQRMGDDRGARERTEELIALLEDVFGAEHPNTLTTRNNYAGILDDAGEYEAAETLLRQTLASRERIFGPNHPDTLASMNSLALILSSRGKEAEAEAMLREAMARIEQTGDQAHPDNLTIMANWATTLHRLDRLEAAEEVERHVLKIRRKAFGEAHPDTVLAMSNLALTLLDGGDSKGAVDLLERALAWGIEHRGADHPLTLNSQANLGSALKEAGDYGRAGELEMDALARRRATLGDAHPDTLTSMGNVACGLRGAGFHEEAMDLELEAFHAHCDRVGPHHPNTLTILNNLAQTLCEMGKHEDALPFQKHVLETQMRLVGPDRAHTLASMSNLAVILRKLDRLEEARKLAEEVFNRRGRLLGANHRDTVLSREHLEEILEALNAPRS